MRIHKINYGPNITKNFCYSLIWFYASALYRMRASGTAKYAGDVLNSVKRK